MSLPEPHVSVRYLVRKAEQVAVLGRLVETCDTPQERRQLVLDLYQCGAIRESTADILIEAYGLENV